MLWSHLSREFSIQRTKSEPMSWSTNPTLAERKKKKTRQKDTTEKFTLIPLHHGLINLPPCDCFDYRRAERSSELAVSPRGLSTGADPFALVRPRAPHYNRMTPGHSKLSWNSPSACRLAAISAFSPEPWKFMRMMLMSVFKNTNDLAD